MLALWGKKNYFTHNQPGFIYVGIIGFSKDIGFKTGWISIRPSLFTWPQQNNLRMVRRHAVFLPTFAYKIFYTHD
jgi:hypothetical protein